jgi:hypothetical protein
MKMEEMYTDKDKITKFVDKFQQAFLLLRDQSLENKEIENVFEINYCDEGDGIIGGRAHYKQLIKKFLKDYKYLYSFNDSKVKFDLESKTTFKMKLDKLIYI